MSNWVDLNFYKLVGPQFKINFKISPVMWNPRSKLKNSQGMAVAGDNAMPLNKETLSSAKKLPVVSQVSK